VRRVQIVLGLGMVALGLVVPGARAAVVVGMVAPATPSTAPCDEPFDLVQLSPAVTYEVPEGIVKPVIASWSTNAAAGAGQQLALKLFERGAAGGEFRQVGHDGPRPITAGTLNTFETNLPVRAGDLLGVGTPSGSAPTACSFGSAIGSFSHQGFLNDGESSHFAAGAGLTNVSAVVEPSHDFTIASIRRKPKKGIAKVGVTVPGPGSLALSGSGIRAQQASGRLPLAAKTVAAGTVELVVRAKGKKRRRLNRTGRVKVKASITYVPTGGSPGTQSTKLKLRKS
jgi:hypothetical protein